MTYFPTPAWCSIKEFLLPPSLPKGRHPTAQALHSAIPLVMMVMKEECVYKTSLWINCALHRRSWMCNNNDNLDYPKKIRDLLNLRPVSCRLHRPSEWWSWRYNENARQLRNDPHHRAQNPICLCYDWDNCYGFAMRNQRIGLKALSISEMREYLTANGITTTNKMKKADLVRLCLSF